MRTGLKAHRPITPVLPVLLFNIIDSPGNKSRFLLRYLVLCGALLWSLTGNAVFAAPPEPHISPYPPRVPADLEKPRETIPEIVPEQDLTLPPLKAVLIVGPIDGDNGSWTNAEKLNMDLAANELSANGVTVYKFYTPNNDWNQIKAAAVGAHFLFYRGHGIYWSAMPTPVVGGFALKDKFVSSDDIRADLRLAPNAIVMLYACFSAGTSGNDSGSISSQEAQRRVAMYSDSFFDIGASGYYADWFGDAFQLLVRYLFQGQTLGQAYESFYDFNRSTVEHYAHPDHPSMVMWLDKDFWDGKTQYNYAFAGTPTLRLVDLFRSTEMEVAPTDITYFATPFDDARAYHVWVRGSEGENLRWSANLEPSNLGWVSVQPASGDSAQPVVVSMIPTSHAVGVYSANLRLHSDSPNVVNPDQTILLTLHVVPQVYTVDLPLTLRSFGGQ